ncbi:hypothetical protein [Leifsonia sp. 2MCAF36]|uniref:hypothetical protein n=1 Tax=Leifsonia sp. 2MCAF36 TaxID=3232988 RepID=UPI003F955103
MTTGTINATAAGVNPVSAQVAGVHTAFIWGAFISLVPVLLSLFIKRRPALGENAAMVH